MVAGFALLFLTALFINLIRRDSDQSDSVLAGILFAVFDLLAAGLMAVAGFTAWREVAAGPLASPLGRRAFHLASVAICLLPAIVFILGLLTALTKETPAPFS